MQRNAPEYRPDKPVIGISRRNGPERQNMCYVFEMQLERNKINGLLHYANLNRTAVTPEQPEEGTPAPSLRLSRWTAVFLRLLVNS